VILRVRSALILKAMLAMIRSPSEITGPRFIFIEITEQ
jgi:hypothetical protein